MESFFGVILFVALWGINPGLGAVTSASFKNASISCYSGGVNNLYDGYSTNPALQCECITQFQNWYHTTNPPTRTLERTIGVGSETKTITSKGSTTTTVIASLTTYTVTVTGNFGGADGFDFYGSATSPCCSSCTIAAATVDLFYFPTPAVKSAATSFVSNNYTFISPSVYIGFSSLYAYDFCGNVGNSYVSTTIGFDPTEISTVGSPTVSIWTLTQTYMGFSSSTITETDTETELVGGPATQIDFRDLGQNCSTLSGYSYLAGNPSSLGDVTYDPCHPTIILPDRVKSVDPAWSSCLNNGIGGFYDPPYPLTSVAAAPPPPSAPPAPAQTLPPPIAPVTTTTTSTAPIETTPIALPQVSPVVNDPSASTSVVPSPAVADPQPSPTPSNVDSSISSHGTTPDLESSISSSLQSPGTTSSSTDPTRPLPNDNLPPQTAPTATEFLIGTQTIKPGSAATESGTTYSLATSGGNIFVNGVLTTPSIGSLVVPPSTEDEFIIGSQTILPGSAITESGTTYSLAPSGNSVFVDGVATTPNIGSLIMSIISPGTTIQEGGGGDGRPTSTALGGHGAGNGSAAATGLGYVQVNASARSKFDVGEWVVILLVGLVSTVSAVL